MQLITGREQEEAEAEKSHHNMQKTGKSFSGIHSVFAIHFLCNKRHKTTLISSASLLQANERNLLRKVIFCNKFEWFYNNLFLFILEVSFLHRVSSPFLNSSSIELIDGKWEKVSIVECAGSTHRVCLFWHFSLVSGDEIHSRLSTDINSKTIFIHCFVEFCRISGETRHSKPASLRRKETHLDAIFNGWATQKGQNRFVSSLPYCGSHYARSIELIFIWYWAKVKIFLGIGRDEVSLRCCKCISSIRSAPDRINHRVLSGANKTRKVINYMSVWCSVFWARFRRALQTSRWLWPSATVAVKLTKNSVHMRLRLRVIFIIKSRFVCGSSASASFPLRKTFPEKKKANFISFMIIVQCNRHYKHRENRNERKEKQNKN